MAEHEMVEKRRGGEMGREWPCGRESSSSPGCMGGMFHHLHFHHLLFAANSSCCRVPSASSPPPSSSSSSSSASLPSRIDRTNLQEHKGWEAPRNSLERDEGKASSSTSSAMEEEFKDVPVAVEIVAPPASLSRSTNKKKTVMFVEEKRRCSSQAETPRTPSLVARLMGLEISAEQSPSLTPKTPPLVERQAQTKKMNAVVDYQRGREPPPPPRRQPLRSLNCNVISSAAATRVGVVTDVGSRSLPESPRSSTSARSYDVDRRLSLQINKEHICYLREVVGDHSLPPSPSPPCSSTNPKKKDSRRCTNDENKSPIVKKVKESLNDEIKSKSRRTRPPEKNLATVDPPPSSICSPRIRSSDVAGSSDDDDIKRRPLAAPPKPSNLGGGGGERDHGEAKVVKVVVSKCKKADHERFTGRIKNQTPHSPCGSRSFPTLATLFQSAHAPPDQRNLPNKNNSSSSPSIFASSRVKEASQAASLTPNSSFGRGLQESNTDKNRPRPALKKDPEISYIKSIFEQAKIAGARTWRWYSSSLPIDPVVFHRLELEFPFFLIGEGDRRKGSGEEDCASRRLLGHLQHRWNRKLLFHLVQEILGDLLVGSSNLSSSTAAASSLIGRENSGGGDGEALLRELVARIERFPAADCRVVGDIDALVAGDMAEANVRRLPLHASVVEEAGDVVTEMEREILDSLLGETAASLARSHPSPRPRRWGHRSIDIGRRHGTLLTETAGERMNRIYELAHTLARCVHVGEDPTLLEKKRT